MSTTPNPSSTMTTKSAAYRCSHWLGQLFPSMLFALLVFTLIAGLLEAPISPILFLYRDPLAIVLYTRCEGDCVLVIHTQFIISLIMSCLTTICLTTAVAAHPDIPPMNESSFTSLKKFLWPIFFPEGMLLKAFRQVLAARTVAQLYNEERREEMENQKLIESERVQRRTSPLRHNSSNGHNTEPPAARPIPWTETHGFYVVMGGLMLYKDNEPLYTLQYSTMERLYRAGQIDLPKLTRRDIMRRSKDGVASKAMALFQVVYFFQDYTRRWKRERSVIDIEIVTILYLIVNGLTFLLYWNKPFYIMHPTRIQLKNEAADKTHKKKNSNKKGAVVLQPS